LLMCIRPVDLQVLRHFPSQPHPLDLGILHLSPLLYQFQTLYFGSAVRRSCGPDSLYLGHDIYVRAPHRDRLQTVQWPVVSAATAAAATATAATATAATATAARVYDEWGGAGTGDSALSNVHSKSASVWTWTWTGIWEFQSLPTARSGRGRWQ